MKTQQTTYGYGLDADIDKRAERLIRNEVLACQTGLVEHLLSRSDEPEAHLSWDDAANLTRPVCPCCSEDTLLDEDSSPDPIKDKDGVPYDYRCTSCGEFFDDPEHEPQDVLEWWLVSSYLATELEERGEPIATDGHSCWWGRTCSGQSILLDGIMQRIIGETM
jgi:hypothetical protein